MKAYLFLAAAATVSACGCHKTSSGLFATSYNGKVYSLNLTQQGPVFELRQTHEDKGCGADPSWLTLDGDAKQLHCLNENWSGDNGTLTSYAVKADGVLTQASQRKVLGGPVAAALYGQPGSRALAIAHYAAGAVSAWQTSGDGISSDALAKYTYTMEHPGPVKDRQDAPHPHHAIVDPTGYLILVPDLGADLVRVYAADPMTNHIGELPAIQATAGSGPRHAAFWSPTGGAVGKHAPVYLFVVGELANTVTTFAVKYDMQRTTVAFKKLGEVSSLGGTTKALKGTYAAEIAVSPDNRFVVVSNRGDASVEMPSPVEDGETVDADSLVTFRPALDGTLKFESAGGAGGSFPRSFQIHPQGNLVAVGLQYSKSVAVLHRDVQSGKIGDVVAYLGGLGNVSSTIWG